MKIKRFKNLWLMGLILSASILGVIYFMKLCFPQFVIEVAQIDSIVKIGHYIDTHKWAWYLASGIMAFASYYLICGASCSKRKLNFKENTIIISTILILFFVREFLPNQYTILNYFSQILLPLIFKGKFKNTVIMFGTINLLQTITLEIRGLSTLISNYNFATFTILMIDVYILEVLLYLAFNYKKGDK
jgi:hypothetical protein